MLIHMLKVACFKTPETYIMVCQCFLSKSLVWSFTKWQVVKVLDQIKCLLYLDCFQQTPIEFVYPTRHFAF